jgi:hypothetical protein
MTEAVLASPRILPCPHCGIGLAGEAVHSGVDTRCVNCGAAFRATLFPSFWVEAERTPTRPTPTTEGEASCFFHPENRAARACDRCGRFVCSVCEITFGANHLCPSCLSVGITDPRKAEFVAWRFLWADAALVVGGLPLIGGLFIWPALPITGLAAIFLAIFGWKRPGSIPRGRRHWAAVVGAICGLLQFGIFAGIIFAITWGLRQ